LEVLANPTKTKKLGGSKTKEKKPISIARTHNCVYIKQTIEAWKHLNFVLSYLVVINGPVFFFWGGGGGAGFPCSQSVPNKFPKMFPIAPWFCPKLNSHQYELKKVISRRVHLLSKGPMRGASIGGMPNVPQKLLMDQSIWLLYF